MEITNIEQIELMVKKNIGIRAFTNQPERARRHIEIIRMYVLEEMSMEKVGKKLGISRQAVWEILQRYGIKRKYSPPRYKITKGEIDNAIDRKQERIRERNERYGENRPGAIEKRLKKIEECEKYRDIAYDWWIGNEPIGQIMATYKLSVGQVSWVISSVLDEVYL